MSISNLPIYQENTISLSRKLNTVWASGNIQLKEDLQKLVFPEGVYYDRKTHSFRTEKVNFIFELIALSSGPPPEKKKGTSDLIDYLSLSAEREGFEPSVQLPIQRFSRPSHSTTLASLRKGDVI